MGAGVCCVQKRLDFTEVGGDRLNLPVDILPDVARGTAAGAAAGNGQSHHFARSLPSCTRSSSSRGGPPGDELLSAEVAWQIATDRRQQPYEEAALLPVLYEVRAPELDEPQHTATAVHRKTEVVRTLATFRKPQAEAAQDRLHSYVVSLQHLSACSEELAKVFEVFEDYVNVHLLLEQCTGGTIYERILERQYFTEQESAVLVRHMLQALVPFHESRLYHGSLTPDSFRFLNDSPHSPLKLVDFGIELKVHRWDAMEHMTGGPDIQNPHCPQFYETCKLVFCAPEMAPPHQPKRKTQKTAAMSSLVATDTEGWQAVMTPRAADGEQDLLDGDLLGDVIDEHADWFHEQEETLDYDYNRKFESADLWSIGAIAFLLLCGYPPFFAPSRNTILGRIHRGEISFDPPFWSKISEEAKSFVMRCLQPSCWDRCSLAEALEHPWIQRLADSSPSGSMFTSFMLNLRRFYRTSLIEMYVANMLATKFRREDMHDFLRRCREIDMCSTGFFTASDLKHVLSALGHGSVAEAITARFLRAFRHPGESYIDYVALIDSIYLRQQRIFEEELWRHFQRVCQSSLGGRAAQSEGEISTKDLGVLFSDPVVMGLLTREIPENAGVEEVTVCQRLQNGVRQHCSDLGATELGFRSLAALLLKLVRSYSQPRDLQGADMDVEAVEMVSTLL